MSAQSHCADCGWASTLAKSEAVARYALTKHSCDKHRADIARAERVAARKAASGPLRECAHPRARHVHGTRAAYVLDRCRCRACRDATASAERRRQKEIAYGKWKPYVDAQPAREHIRALGAAGMGWKRVCAVSGVPHGTMAKLLYGDTQRRQAPSARVRPATAAAILAVELDLAGGVLVDDGPTRRRIHGLVAHGYSMRWISQRLGSNSPLQLRGDGQVRKSTADAVEAMVERYAGRPGPSSWARAFAARRGWTPDLLWDDDLGPADTDVDEAAVLRRLVGERIRLNAAEQAEVVARWQSSGRPLAECERVTGINPHRVRRGAT